MKTSEAMSQEVASVSWTSFDGDDATSMSLYDGDAFGDGGKKRRGKRRRSSRRRSRKKARVVVPDDCDDDGGDEPQKLDSRSPQTVLYCSG